MSFFSGYVPAGQPGETTRFFVFPAFVSFEQMDGVSQAWSTLSAVSVIPNASCCHSGFLLDTLPFCSSSPVTTYFSSVPSSTQPKCLFPVKWQRCLVVGGGVVCVHSCVNCMIRWIVCRWVQLKSTWRSWRRLVNSGCRKMDQIVRRDGSQRWKAGGLSPPWKLKSLPSNSKLLLPHSYLETPDLMSCLLLNLSWKTSLLQTMF